MGHWEKIVRLQKFEYWGAIGKYTGTSFYILFTNELPSIAVIECEECGQGGRERDDLFPQGCKTCSVCMTYADDVSHLVAGKDLDTLRGRMRESLGR